MKFKKLNKNRLPKFGVYWILARCPRWSLAPNPLVDIVDPEHKYTFLRMFTGVLGQDPQLSRSQSPYLNNPLHFNQLDIVRSGSLPCDAEIIGYAPLEVPSFDGYIEEGEPLKC